MAKEIFEEMWNSSKTPDEIISSKGLQQVTDEKEILALIDKSIEENPKQVEQFKSGKDKLLGFFVGQVMKSSQGKANPQQVNELIKKRLEE